MTDPAESTPAVVVNELVKCFGNFTAVDHISFTVPTGEIFGFLGPNGAGKSTTIRMLCGILLPTAGTGCVAGFDIMRQPEQIKKTIGYMSQKFSLYESLTVTENINFYGGIYGVSPARLAERRAWVLAMAGLEARKDSLTGELSTGFKQRLALGTAMIHDPKILFLDEPTAGVDPISRREFWELIYTVSGQGVTIFVTTHFMDDAEHCDRLGLIYGGRLIALGSPAELKAQYRSGILLEVAGHPLMPALEALQQYPPARDVTIFGQTLHLRVEEESAIDPLCQSMTAAGISDCRVTRIAPSLEDVFVAYIEEADAQSSADGG